MNAVVEWVKANVLIVVFAVLMLAAAVTLPILSGRMNNSVKSEVSARAQNFAKLSQLEKGEILPGHVGVPNDETLRKYEEIARVVADDAANVRRGAVEHNRKNRNVLLPALFPEPPATQIDVLPKRFHDALLDAYGSLLAEVNAGMPPPLESMREQLDLVRKQFITQDLKKDTTQALEPGEQKLLTEKLSSVRMSLCVDAAAKTSLYVSTNELAVPQWNQANQPSLGELFNWQWQFWVVSDVVRALHEVNKKDQTVRSSPVKQVLSLMVTGLPAPADTSPGAAGASGSATGRVGFGGAAAMDSGANAPAETVAPVTGPANPKAEIAKNYAISMTGRSTNPLYDVVHVELDLIVENARLPQVLDALARYNFMTVIGIAISATDPFDALQGGFFFGAAPVSQVHLTIETIWLREWTQLFMPKSIKQALGIPDAKPAVESSDV